MKSWFRPARNAPISFMERGREGRVSAAAIRDGALTEDTIMNLSHRLGLTMLIGLGVAGAVFAQSATPRAHGAPRPATAAKAATPRDDRDLMDDDDDMGSAHMGVMERMGGGRPGWRAMMGGRMARRAEIARDLQLTDAQRDQITTIRERQTRRGIQQRGKLAEARLDLRQLLRDDHADRARLDHQVETLVQLRSDLMKSRLETLVEMRSVLTPDQRKKLRDELGGGRL